MKRTQRMTMKVLRRMRIQTTTLTLESHLWPSLVTWVSQTTGAFLSGGYNVLDQISVWFTYSFQIFNPKLLLFLSVVSQTCVILLELTMSQRMTAMSGSLQASGLPRWAPTCQPCPVFLCCPPRSSTGFWKMWGAWGTATCRYKQLGTNNFSHTVSVALKLWYWSNNFSQAEGLSSLGINKCLCMTYRNTLLMILNNVDIWNWWGCRLIYFKGWQLTFLECYTANMLVFSWHWSLMKSHIWPYLDFYMVFLSTPQHK